MEILNVRNLNFTYSGFSDKAIDNISFSVERGGFIVICGATGSGKTTLLRLLKPEIIPSGELSGDIFLGGEALPEIGGKASASRIGYVAQRPEQQIVTDKVWHEIAFGLENLGVPTDVIRRRTAEMAAYFGIEEWFMRDTSSLSGGQKQLLNLASVMVMQPDILLLDEPTAQLDPIAASGFISTVKKLNRDLSLTVIMVEHRLDEVIPAADKLMVLDNGRLLTYNDTRRAVEEIRNNGRLIEGLPAAVRIYCALGKKSECPLTVREGRDFIENSFSDRIKSLDKPVYEHSREKALELSGVFFRYEKAAPDILCGLDLTVFRNEIFFILGGNGSGKSTALSVISGIHKPYSGVVKVFGRKLKDYKNNSLYNECLSLLPQDVQTVFLHNTVREELEDCGADISSMPFGLTDLLDKHPYDLSGGQQQLVALAKVLANKPKLLLLDEPTKGLDAYFKKQITGLIKKLRECGITIIVVTHDAEFAAECADRCAMFFRGEIVSCDIPGKFFADNSFYTTEASRITRGIYENITTVSEAAEICRLNGERNGDARNSE